MFTSVSDPVISQIFTAPFMILWSLCSSVWQTQDGKSQNRLTKSKQLSQIADSILAISTSTNNCCGHTTEIMVNIND